eukprot:gene8483-10426_t
MNLNQIKYEWSEQGFIAFNDHAWLHTNIMNEKQHTYNTNIKEYKSLSKGIIVFKTAGPNKDTGFQIRHSVPGFPIPEPSSSTAIRLPRTHATTWFPANDFTVADQTGSPEISLGHTFLCHSFPDVKTLAGALRSSHPYIYRTNAYPVPAPYDTTQLKDLFNNQINLESTLSIGTDIKIIVANPNYLKTNNLSPTSSLKLPQKGFNIITETHLSSEFSIGIPPKLKRWRSSIDSSNVAINLMDKSDHTVCLSDIFINTPNYDSVETNICIKSEILSTFLRVSTYKIRAIDATTESIFNQHQIFEGPLKMYPSNPFQSGSVLSQHYESFPDYFLKSTMVEFNDFTPKLYTALSESKIISTDENGILKFNKNYNPQGIKVLLSDSSTLGLKFVISGSNPQQIVSLPIQFQSNNLEANTHVSSDQVNRNLVFLYKILQATIQQINLDFGSLSPPKALDPVVVHFNPTSKTALINGLTNIVIKLDQPLSVESVLRSISYSVILKLNANYRVDGVSLDNFEFDIVSTNPFLPIVRGLVNVLSMHLRQSVFPTLPQPIIQSLDTFSSNSRQIEYFDNKITFYSCFCEGWVTSFFWDLIDNNKDSRNSMLYRNDINSISIGTILSAITQPIKPNDIFEFINHLKSTSPSDKLEFIDQTQLYNNIIDCPLQTICTPTISPNPNSLKDQFTSRGICIEEINTISNEELMDYVNLWTDDGVIEVDLIDWTKNRLFPVVYDDPNRNQKLANLVPYIKGDSLDCDLNLPSVTPPSLSLMMKISVQLVQLIQKSTTSYVFRDVLAIHYIPSPVSPTTGLGIVTYGGELCNFDFMNLDTFKTGQLFNQCPINPVITNVSPLNGPTTSTPDTMITITGRSLFNPDMKIRIGPKECQIQSRIPSTDASVEDDSIICKLPNGVGYDHLVTATLPTPTILPDRIYPTEYIFEYDGPITTSIIYQSAIGVKKLLNPTGSLVTIVGKNFFESKNPTTVSSQTTLQLLIDEKEYPIQKVYQSGGNDYIIFNAIGVGANLIVDIRVGLQSSVSNPLSVTFELNYHPPEISSISTTSSPVDGGGRLTVYGKYFPPTAEFITYTTVYIGSVDCQNIVWINSGTVVVDIPLNIGANRPVFIEVYYQTSVASQTFSYHPPEIYQIVYQSIKTNTESVFWVTGINLGTKYEGYVPEVDFIIGQEKIPLYCQGDDAVYMNRQAPPPEPEAPEEGEDPLPGYDPYNDLSDEYKTSVDFDCFRCLMPMPGVGSDFEIQVLVFNQRVSSRQLKYPGPQGVSFNKPHLTKIYTGETEPPAGQPAQQPIPTNGAQIVKLNFKGKDFVPNEQLAIVNLHRAEDQEEIKSLDSGPEHNNIQIIFNEDLKFDCNKDVVWVSSKLVKCTAPPGFGKNLPVKIHVGGQLLDNYADESPEVRVSYQEPTVRERNPSTDPKPIFTLGKQHRITISGSNFVPPTLVEQMNAQLEKFKLFNNIFMKDRECTDIKWIDDERVTCLIPLDSGKDIPVKVMVGGVESQPVTYYSFEKPVIHSIDPYQGNYVDKITVTIKGENFGVVNGETPDPIIYFDGAPVPPGTCGPLTLIEDSIGNKNQLICEIGPFDHVKEYQVTLEQNGQISDDVTFETYDGPKITSITPASGSVDGGYEITIAGTNLVDPNLPDPKVIFNTIEIHEDSITELDEEMIIFVSPSGGGAHIPITVKLENGQSGTSKAFSYDPPSISSINPNSSPSKTTQRIAISGTNLGVPIEQGQINNDVTVKIGSFPCSHARVVSSNLVYCQSPYGTPGISVGTYSFKGQSASPFSFIYHDEPTATPSTSTGGGGGPIPWPGLLLVFTMAAAVPAAAATGTAPFVILFTYVLGEIHIESSVEIETEFNIEGGKTIKALIKGTVKGKTSMIPTPTVLNSPPVLDFVNNILDSSIDQNDRPIQQQSQQQQLFGNTMQLDNILVFPIVIKTENSYVYDHDTYYECTSTVTLETTVIHLGQPYYFVILKGTLTGDVPKPTPTPTPTDTPTPTPTITQSPTDPPTPTPTITESPPITPSPSSTT